MLNKEFCYWLQGFFEIGGRPSWRALQPFQVIIIQNHLALTKEVEGLTPGGFCVWLEMALRTQKIDQHLTTDIRGNLNAVFQHDIDNTYPGDPARLQAIHDGKHS